LCDRVAVIPGRAEATVADWGRPIKGLGNLGATDHHPIHIDGHHFRITATYGEDISLSAQWPETTALVAVGQTRSIELIADASGTVARKATEADLARNGITVNERSTGG
jgi:Multicopper oxidase